MPQRYSRILIFACLMLSACSSTSEDSVSDMFNFGHHPPKAKPAEPRYCYKTYEDIVCYSKPIAGDEDRLVGYQDASGKTGYTMPSKIVHTTTETTTTTVTHTSPPPVPGGPSNSTASDGKQLKEIIFDPSELEPKELVPDKPQ